MVNEYFYRPHEDDHRLRCVFKFIHLGVRIYAFRVSVLIVFVWTEGLNAEKSLLLLSFAFTIVFVWTGPKIISLYIQNCSSQFFHVVFALCLGTLYISSFTHARFQNQVFQGSVPSWSHVVLFVVGTRDIETVPLKLDTDASQYGVSAIYFWSTLSTN